MLLSVGAFECCRLSISAIWCATIWRGKFTSFPSLVTSTSLPFLFPQLLPVDDGYNSTESEEFSRSSLLLQRNCKCRIVKVQLDGLSLRRERDGREFGKYCMM